MLNTLNIKTHPEYSGVKSRFSSGKIKITYAALVFLFCFKTAMSQMTVVINVSPGTIVCQYQTVTFTSQIFGCQPGFTSVWNVDGVPMQNITSTIPSTTFMWLASASGSHCISCTVTSSSATCNPNTSTSNTICITVIQNEPPSVSITATDYTICLGSLDVFTATPIDAGGACATYTWYVDAVPDGSSTISTFNYVPLTAGIHVVYCVIHSCDSCDNQPPVNNPDANSNVVTVNVVICNGINELQTNSLIKIFPNPSTGKLNLQWENPSGVVSEIFISDGLGRIISTYKSEKNYLNVEPALNRGVYTVTIISGDRTFRSPVVIY